MYLWTGLEGVVDGPQVEPGYGLPLVELPDGLLLVGPGNGLPLLGKLAADGLPLVDPADGLLLVKNNRNINDNS